MERVVDELPARACVRPQRQEDDVLAGGVVHAAADGQDLGIGDGGALLLIHVVLGIGLRFGVRSVRAGVRSAMSRTPCGRRGRVTCRTGEIYPKREAGFTRRQTRLITRMSCCPNSLRLNQLKVGLTGFEPATSWSRTKPLGDGSPGKQGDSAAPPIGYTTGYTSPTGTAAEQLPSTAPPDLLQLLAQLAALPADQRAMLSRLLTPPAAAVPPAGPTLDDSLPPALERTADRQTDNAKGDTR